MVIFMVVIIVYGGVGIIRKEERIFKVIEGVREVVFVGWRELKRGFVLDVVEEVVKVFEDNFIFNVGIGSVFIFDGKVEMDVVIMCGKMFDVGVVVGIWGVKNLISVVRKVMEKIDYVFLIGEGVVKFVRLFGFEEYDLIMEERFK